MASITDIIRDIEQGEKKLTAVERKLKALDADLRLLDEADARLKAIRAVDINTLTPQQLTERAAGTADVRKQVATVSRRSATRSAVSPSAASATREMRYADDLAEQLELGGTRLKKRLPGVAREVIGRPRSTTTDLRNALAIELKDEAGKMAPYMARFLQASLGSEFTSFADPDWGMLYGSADDIISKILLGGPERAGEYSGNLSRFVLSQVDRTQDGSPYLFTRHVEANSCAWCRGQVSEYEISGRFLRHTNCRCIKVRK